MTTGSRSEERQVVPIQMDLPAVLRASGRPGIPKLSEALLRSKSARIPTSIHWNTKPGP